MLETERSRVANQSAKLAERTPGRSGNLSLRTGDRFAITPTGIPYDEIEPADVSVVGVDDGEALAGKVPSSETPMHTRIYTELDVGAIVHTHSPWATTLAILREPLPPVHYMLASAGTRIPVADYAAYGTAELADNAVEALRGADSMACLLANHGLVATGPDLPTAMEILDTVEFTAQLYVRASSMGDPVQLAEAEMERVAERLQAYGQPD